MSILELRDVELPVVEWASEHRILSIKLNLQGNRGWPDRLFLLPGGRVLFQEYKRPGEKVKGRQSLVHRVLRKLGFEVQTHDNAEMAIEALRCALDAQKLR